MLSPASRARSISQLDPGAGAPGFMLSPASRAQSIFSTGSWSWRPRLYAVARFAGSIYFFNRILGLAPQALCCRPLRGLQSIFSTGSWGWRPRLYAVARFAGSIYFLNWILGREPQALCCRPLRGLRKTKCSLHLVIELAHEDGALAQWLDRMFRTLELQGLITGHQHLYQQDLDFLRSVRVQPDQAGLRPGAG